MLRSPLRRLSAAQIVSGAAALAAAAALAVPAALAGPAGPNSNKNNNKNNSSNSTKSQTALSAAQQDNEHLSPATRQRLASIGTQVSSLISKMTVAEKVGQLEQAGPSGANGTPGQALLDAVKSGQVGSVLDLTRGGNINP